MKFKSASIYFPIWLTPEHHFCLFWLLFIPAFECKETVRKFMNEVLLTFQTLLCTRAVFCRDPGMRSFQNHLVCPVCSLKKRFKWTHLHFTHIQFSCVPASAKLVELKRKERRKEKKNKPNTKPPFFL